MKRRLVLVAFLVVGSIGAVGSPVGAEAEMAPLVLADDSAIPGSYIIVASLEPGDPGAEELLDHLTSRAEQLGGTVEWEFDTVAVGFSAQLPPPAVDVLRRENGVAHVEQNRQVSVPDDRPAIGEAAVASDLVASDLVAWEVDRIDQRDLPLDHEYNLTASGDGIDVYIVDSGVDPDLIWGETIEGVNFAPEHGDEPPWADCSGHGNEVALHLHNTSPDARLIAVRTMDCDNGGDQASAVAGLEWIADHADGPSIANLSWGSSVTGRLDPLWESAINELVDLGVVVVAAAGNHKGNACGVSPARLTDVVTVGAFHARSDETSGWHTNFGPCIDIYAPAYSTSFAAPMVAGATANFWSADPGATSDVVINRVLEAGTPDRLTFTPSHWAESTENLIVYAMPELPAPNAVAVSPGTIRPQAAPALDPGEITLTASAQHDRQVEYRFVLEQYVLSGAWQTIYDSGFGTEDSITVDLGPARRILVRWEVTARRHGEVGQMSQPRYFSFLPGPPPNWRSTPGSASASASD